MAPRDDDPRKAHPAYESSDPPPPPRRTASVMGARLPPPPSRQPSHAELSSSELEVVPPGVARDRTYLMLMGATTLVSAVFAGLSQLFTGGAGMTKEQAAKIASDTAAILENQKKTNDYLVAKQEADEKRDIIFATMVCKMNNGDFVKGFECKRQALDLAQTLPGEPMRVWGEMWAAYPVPPAMTGPKFDPR